MTRSEVKGGEPDKMEEAKRDDSDSTMRYDGRPESFIADRPALIERAGRLVTQIIAGGGHAHAMPRRVAATGQRRAAQDIAVVRQQCMRARTYADARYELRHDKADEEKERDKLLKRQLKMEEPDSNGTTNPLSQSSLMHALQQAATAGPTAPNTLFRDEHESMPSPIRQRPTTVGEQMLDMEEDTLPPITYADTRHGARRSKKRQGEGEG